MVCELSIPHQATPLRIELFHLLVIEYVSCPAMVELPLSSSCFPFQNPTSPPSGRKVLPRVNGAAAAQQSGKVETMFGRSNLLLAPTQRRQQRLLCQAASIRHAERLFSGRRYEAVLQEAFKGLKWCRSGRGGTSGTLSCLLRSATCSDSLVIP